MLSNQSELRLNSLINILAEQVGIYQQLLVLAQKERAAVATSQLNVLDEVIAEKTYLIQKVGETEKLRLELMDSLAASYNLNSDHFTLRDLADRVDKSSSDKLIDLRSGLLSVLKKLKGENNNNKKLMSHCITLMDNSINLLNSMNCQETTYVQSGHFTKAQEGGVLFTGKI